MPPRIKRQDSHILPNQPTELLRETRKAQRRVPSAMMHDNNATASQGGMIRTDNESARREFDLKSLSKVLPVRVRTNRCMFRIGDSRRTSRGYTCAGRGESIYRQIVTRKAYGGGGPIVLLPGDGSEPSESAISSVSS